MVHFIDKTHGTTSFSTISNKIRNQFEEISEANELISQIYKFSEGECPYRFDSITN